MVPLRPFINNQKELIFSHLAICAIYKTSIHGQIISFQSFFNPGGQRGLFLSELVLDHLRDGAGKIDIGNINGVTAVLVNFFQDPASDVANGSGDLVLFRVGVIASLSGNPTDIRTLLFDSDIDQISVLNRPNASIEHIIDPGIPSIDGALVKNLDLFQLRVDQFEAVLFGEFFEQSCQGHVYFNLSSGHNPIVGGHFEHQAGAV